MIKEIPRHRDKLGQELQLDDCVAFPSSNSLLIGKIVKLTPKLVRVAKLPAPNWRAEWNKYPVDIIKLDSAAVTMFLLKGV
jgi:hypothetical protein